jgi:hypothetical protein
LIFYLRLVVDGHFSGLKRFGFGPPEFRRLVAQLATEEGVADVDMLSG